MNFNSFIKLDRPSPISHLDLNISPVPGDHEIRSILKRSVPTHSKKVSWNSLEKVVKVLDPVNPDDADSHHSQRLEALRKDVSLYSFVPVDLDLEASASLSSFSDAVRKDTMLSPFIPKEASKVLSSKDLSAMSSRIRRSLKSEALLNYFCKYFRLKSKESPELIGEAIDKLRMNKHTKFLVKSAVFELNVETDDESDYVELESMIEKIRSNEDLERNLFFKISKTCQKKDRFNEFVEVLLDLMPLREVREIRLVFDLIAIAEKLNTHLPEAVQLKEVEKLCEMHHLQVGQVLANWLEKTQVYLGAIAELNLSGVEIQSFPLRIIKYIRNVERLTLARLHLMPVVFRDLCKFPKLEYLNLASNHLNADDLNCIFDDIKTVKNLKAINLSNNPIRLGEISEIVEYCQENNIELLLPPDRKVQDYETILAANSSDPSKPILCLNLSRLAIESVPEALMEKLSNVVSVIFKQSLASPPQTLQIMKTVLKLPKVISFDFSNNDLSPQSINSLIDAAEAYAPNAMMFRDLSKAESDLMLVLERIGEDITLDVAIPKRFKNASDLWCQIQPSIETQKEALKELKHLDFSNMAIETLPSEFLAYFSSVESISLNTSYPKKGKYGSSFSCLLSLPKLEEIDLSNNYLSPSMFENLIDLVENPEKALNTIILSGCECNEEDLEYFTNICEESDVDLVFDEEVDEMEESFKRERETLDEDDDEMENFAKRMKIDN